MAYLRYTKSIQKTYKMTEYTLTKKIAKQGDKSVIIIPSFLQDELKPHTVVEVKIKVINNDR